MMDSNPLAIVLNSSDGVWLDLPQPCGNLVGASFGYQLRRMDTRQSGKRPRDPTAPWPTPPCTIIRIHIVPVTLPAYRSYGSKGFSRD